MCKIARRFSTHATTTAEWTLIKKEGTDEYQTNDLRGRKPASVSSNRPEGRHGLAIYSPGLAGPVRHSLSPNGEAEQSFPPHCPIQFRTVEDTVIMCTAFNHDVRVAWHPSH